MCTCSNQARLEEIRHFNHAPADYCSPEISSASTFHTHCRSFVVFTSTSHCGFFVLLLFVALESTIRLKAAAVSALRRRDVTLKEMFSKLDIVGMESFVEKMYLHLFLYYRTISDEVFVCFFFCGTRFVSASGRRRP